MSSRALYCCFVCVLITVSGLPALAGGAWVHRPGKYYFEIAYSYYEAGDFFNRKGDRTNLRIVRDPTNPASIFLGRENSTYKQLDGSVYLEYGLPHSLELSLNFAFYVQAQQDSDIGKFQVEGIRDATLGLKYQWFDQPWLLSAFQVEIGFPIGDADAQGPAPGQVPQPIPLGDNEWDFALRLSLSRSFYPFPLYFSADFGYRYRTSGTEGADFADDLPWSVEGGHTLKLSKGEWFSALTTIFAIRGLISTEDRPAIGFGTIDVTGFASNQKFINLETSLSLRVYQTVSFFAGYGYNLAGKNTGAGWGARFGFSLQN